MNNLQTPHPAIRPYPSKLFVEATTRCNLRCEMCVKQTTNGAIHEGDLSSVIFDALGSAWPHIEALVLNGIGEPLLHPRLETFVAQAKAAMPAASWIGFQTNGQLLSAPRALALVAAGLDRICLSTDALSASIFRQVRAGGEFSDISQAIRHLRLAQKRLKRDNPVIGVEFVVRRDNLYELPAVLEWAAGQGIRFAIVTHLIAYDPAMAAMAAYDRNTDDAIAFFERWKAKAIAAGIDLDRYFEVCWKYKKTPQEQRLVDFVNEMIARAAEHDIFLHLKSLLERDVGAQLQTADVFAQALEVADRNGIDLRLPAITPQGQKRCEFIESGSVFVSWKGDVHPCYFLWHQYSCFVSGWQRQVDAKSFGSLADDDVVTIWNRPEFLSFRQTVAGYEYPLCSNCNLAPCDYIELAPFEQDCYTNTIPCCDCQWCLGVFQCMQ